MATLDKVLGPLFEGLKPREREVLEGRFGFGKEKETQTLAAIGKRYKITRERVRQIEASALGHVRRKLSSNKGVTELIERTKKYLKAVHGVAKKEHVVEHHRSQFEDAHENHLALLIEVSDAFRLYPEDEAHWAFYYLDKQSLKNAVNFIEQFVKFLRPHKEKVLAGGFEDLFGQFVRREGVSEAQAKNFIATSKKFHKSPFGDTGLAEWPEVLPRVTRDQIYLILRKKREPLHFVQIANLINEAGFDRNREALVPTVHNELIKDPRFVLVGRGIYGLSEHGYEPGTVREVIQRILKKNGPMKPKEILAEVNKERMLKPNTILINLQNKAYFEKLIDGRYRLR